MSRFAAVSVALAVFLAGPCGTCALNVARRGSNQSNVSAALQPRIEVAGESLVEQKSHVNLVGEAEVSLGGFEVRKSSATKALVQKLRSSIAEIVPGPTVVEIFWGGLFYVVSATICALAYRMVIYAEPSEASEVLLQEQKDILDFEFGAFSPEKCDLQLAFCSFACLCIRWPSTVSNEKLKLIAFWPAFFIFTVLEGFTGIIYGLLLVIWIGIAVFFRQQIREFYGLPFGTAGTYLQDCLLWTFCCCFAGAQEAKQVERVQNVYGPTGITPRVPVSARY